MDWADIYVTVFIVSLLFVPAFTFPFMIYGLIEVAKRGLNNFDHDERLILVVLIIYQTMVWGSMIGWFVTK